MQSEDDVWGFIFGQPDIDAFVEYALRSQGASTYQVFDDTNGLDQRYPAQYYSGLDILNSNDREKDIQAMEIDSETPLESGGTNSNDIPAPVYIYNIQPQIGSKHRVDTRKWMIDIPSLPDCFTHSMQTSSRPRIQALSPGLEVSTNEKQFSNAIEDDAFVGESTLNTTFAGTTSSESFPQSSNFVQVASSSTLGNNPLPAAAYYSQISDNASAGPGNTRSTNNLPAPQGILTLADDTRCYSNNVLASSLRMPSPTPLSQLHSSSETIVCTYDGCDKTFSELRSRDRHISTVHDRRRFFCPGNCRKDGFYREDTLKYHLDNIPEDSTCFIEAKKHGWDRDVKASVQRLREYVSEE